MRSVSHQMNMAKFPVHRDLAGFDFAASRADPHLIKELATLSFTDTAENAVLPRVNAASRQHHLYDVVGF